MDIQKVLCDRLIISSDPDIMSGTSVFVTSGKDLLYQQNFLVITL
ncbi:hypothetical protein COO91_03269 [Nostoc flagelliforme CCNUN1]|uniref:Uncharacterized protein n=1 Tax=Nostoc flagelliforme CCNUN1 TaxID=2038116 RepID=A0A2K8SPF8_9NOSO|nr:hypothetical protein [Nostoc flagelliforme]AUB37329.1 hypothetical protein COO91_03269 [Nostoc flagelliforme CCNUN1]